MIFLTLQFESHILIVSYSQSLPYCFHYNENISYKKKQRFKYQYYSIIRLLEICSEIINTNELTEAEMLTPFAITTRYPGEDEEVTKEEALEAIRIADLVKEKITKRLKLTG